jgi:4'-phosphopantetheinyl transferase EntD
MIADLFHPAVTTVRATPDMWRGEGYPEEMLAVAQATEKRRREFVAGRLCAREALNRLGIDHFPLLANPDRTPRWPPDVVGSIAHCPDYCGVAVARRGEIVGVGLDVERGGRLPADIVSSVCSAEELESLADVAAPSPHDWAKVIFSAKEAFYKCYYPLTGCYLDFHDVHVRVAPGGRFVAQLVPDNAPSIAGRRQMVGRWSSSVDHVFTGVTCMAKQV